MSYLNRLGLRSANYDTKPFVKVPDEVSSECWCGWQSIVTELKSASTFIAVECYPGVDVDSLLKIFEQSFPGASLVDSRQSMKSEKEVDEMVAPFLGGDDRVFGYMNTTLSIKDFFDPAKVETLQEKFSTHESVVVVGPGASWLFPGFDLLVYADMPRWEGQLRQRRGEADNLGTQNRGLSAPMQYKRSYFIDWRVADRLKQQTLASWDYVLDTCEEETPKMMSGKAHLTALKSAVAGPFRVVPFFDPGPWGGQWMKEVCQLPDGPPNYAWCFDGVPEENSMLLEFTEDVRIEIPSMNLVFHHPVDCLGEPVYGRFGPEFPIRFDFLDTMQGGNLSFQVHPLTEFARENFGIPYTQDESYYILDAEEDAVVYLGCNDDTDPEEMFTNLEDAQEEGGEFDAEKFAATFPAKKHDHFLIPAGTLHCSGKNSMVLEISATPYIFTFKLWDWNRLGLDGRPRPVNLERGKQVVRWDRDKTYARNHLVNQVEVLADGEGWREERTGLHAAEFIETRRHWFTAVVPHNTGGAEKGSVQVLNLVQGEAAVVESPTGAFPPFEVHYAETFILPASVGAYTIRPVNEGEECATMKAFVRVNA